MRRPALLPSAGRTVERPPAPGPADAPAGPDAGATTRPRVAPRRRRRLPRPKALLRSTHRWLSLTLGIVLVLLTTTGAILLYEPQLQRVFDPSHYRATPSSRPLTLEGATAAIQQRRGGTATYAERDGDVYAIYLTTEAGKGEVVHVDPGNGRVLAVANGPTGVLGLINNFHQCFLTCEGYPGYVPAFAHPMADIGIPGVEKLTVGGFVLGVFGLLLILIAVTGIVIWWPKPKRKAWRKSMTVRWKKGSYARNYDLHKTIGVVAIPFLLMWGITGANFELPVVSKAWFGALPGSEPSYPALTSTSPKGPDIGVARAEAAARRELGRPGRLTTYSPPADGDPTGTYAFGFATDSIPRAASPRIPNNQVVEVDRRDPTRAAIDGQGASGRPLATTVCADWFTPLHFGSLVDPWWRAIWFLLGMAPLALAITGTATWLWKRRKKRDNQRRKRARAAAATSS